MRPLDAAGRRTASIRPARSGLGLACAAALLLSACEGDGPATVAADGAGATVLSVTPPAPLLESRAVDRSALSVVIEVDGQNLSVEAVEGGAFRARTLVTAGSTIAISISWFESVSGQRPEARLRRA